jgi:GMP synthase-like glutamine amidotransferase
MPDDVIVYVGFAQPNEWEGMSAMYGRHARRFEEASGHPCIVVPFGAATPGLMRRIAPSAVVLSGFCRSFEEYDARAFDAVAEFVDSALDMPILAICGSHQLLGFQFNGTLRTSVRLHDEPMRLRHPGEPIVVPEYHAEYFMERGYYELTLHADDPLFTGCGRPPIVFESHYCEVKTLPPDFRLIASTPDCRIQAMRYETRPLVSVQFHPEEYTDAFPDGKAILENFFRVRR